MRFSATFVLALLIWPGARVFAAPAAVVEGLQLPAWRVQSGARAPLAPGLALATSDSVQTGPRARVVLRLAEGSTVKLGEDANLELAELTAPPAADGVFTGVLNVLKGAFRFTTTAAGKLRSRNITARVGTATIGIRGTDVWGKAEAERDFVVLIEGEIELSRGTERLTMREPQTLFMAPKGEAALPVAPVAPDDLGRWAAETELHGGTGVMSGSGRYRINVSSYRDAAGARRYAAALSEAGYPVEVQEASIAGATWTRVSLGGFDTRADAAAVAATLAQDFAAISPWIVHE